MNEKHDFESFANRKLDETVDAMDGVTRTRLAAMRRGAVSPAVASRRVRRGWWLPISLATAMVALTLVWMAPQQQGEGEVEVAALEDLDFLASDVELDLLEDVEFYQWLDDGDHAG